MKLEKTKEEHALIQLAKILYVLKLLMQKTTVIVEQVGYFEHTNYNSIIIHTLSESVKSGIMNKLLSLFLTELDKDKTEFMLSIMNLSYIKDNESELDLMTTEELLNIVVYPYFNDIIKDTKLINCVKLLYIELGIELPK